MGDRANVYVKNTEKSGVFLYSHWGGTELPATVQKALQKKERWDDDQYLARIIFQEMIGTDRGTTGFGISSVMGDNSYPIIYVDCTTQTIGFTEEPKRGEPPAPPPSESTMTFPEFIAKDLSKGGYPKEGDADE